MKSDAIRVACIIQARMGSSRLPGKVSLDLSGQSMLSRVIERVSQVPRVNNIVVATTLSKNDDLVAELAKSSGAQVYRGSEENVLERYVLAAQECSADAVMRITSDCPLLDPKVTASVLDAFLDGGCDYASNMIVRTFPRGLDTEVVTLDALQASLLRASSPDDREHVTWHVRRHPKAFRHKHVTNEVDLSGIRLTVDTLADYQLVAEIYRRLGPSDFGLKEVLDLLRTEPALQLLNKDIRQKSSHHHRE